MLVFVTRTAVRVAGERHHEDGLAQTLARKGDAPSALRRRSVDVEQQRRIGRNHAARAALL